MTRKVQVVGGALPKEKRTRDPAKNRAKLVRATIELVVEKGAAALTLAEAARRAKVSRGTAYKLFGNRERLLNKSRDSVAERLRDGLKQIDKDASLRVRTLYSTKVILSHPEASKIMIESAMAGTDLGREHPLYELLLKRLKQLKKSGRARAGIDLEISAYIMLGSIASTIMLGAQHKGEDVNWLAERFAGEWNRLLQEGIFVTPEHGEQV
jgi:AcrR family transcriptional regulator